jgi:rubrerythrin
MSNNVNHQQTLTGASMGHVAYHAWAEKARHERRFNIARLFDALGAARAVRAEEALHALGMVAGTAANVASALSGAAPEAVQPERMTATTPFARELLLRAERAIAEGRDLRANELGDLYVCGRCGEVREGAIESPCPRCSTVPEAHRPFRAIDAMGALGPNGIMHFLEHAEEGLRARLAGVDDALLAQRPDSERPSIKELVGHLIDMDAVFRERAWLILETERPELPPAHPPRLDSAAVYRDKPIAAILDAYHESRRQTLNLLRGLTKAAWHRTGHHELYGVINLLHQGNWAVSHERGHLVEIAQLRHDLLRADGGAEALTDVIVTGDNAGE